MSSVIPETTQFFSPGLDPGGYPESSSLERWIPGRAPPA